MYSQIEIEMEEVFKRHIENIMWLHNNLQKQIDVLSQMVSVQSEMIEIIAEEIKLKKKLGPESKNNE